MLFLFLMSVLYQIRFWLSTLQEPVGSRPSEHSTPSRGSDTLGASGAVADVVGEASDGHCVALFLISPLYLYYRHNASPFVRYSGIISKYLALVISPYLIRS